MVCLVGVACRADKSLIKIDGSPYAKMQNVGLDEVKITGGFWKQRQEVNRKVSFELLWQLATDEEKGYPLNNFKVAAGIKAGRHQGVAWEDAWLYKWIETASYIYASTGDREVLGRIGSVIPTIAAAQEDDGYIATQVSAGKYKERWLSPHNHELYNMGHLLTAAAVHYRMTGQTDLLDVGNKAAAFCLKQFKEHPDVMWEYPYNPSIIMGAVELYRATGNRDALELAIHVVDLRGASYQGTAEKPDWGRPGWGMKNYKGGTDNYQNYIPLRKETEVIGHAVFFTYLYAGATDVYLETGDRSLLEALERLWGDLTGKKMYVTGGVSPVHKSPVTRNFYGDQRKVYVGDTVNEGVVAPFDLPNATAYNETCGTVGNMMWNWRMLQATGNPCYADIMELSWYNSMLAGMEVDGDHWSYTNPLRWHGAKHELWSHDFHRRHVPGLEHICCPTNLSRNLAAYHAYLFSVSKGTLWVHHFADCEAALEKLGLKLKMTTDYPWDGKITFSIDDAPEEAVAFKLRIPAWTGKVSLRFNGKKEDVKAEPGTYAEISRVWEKGDVLELNLEMSVRLLVGNCRTEQIRNQVAVSRGPVVYCLESNDVQGDAAFEQVAIDADVDFESEYRSDLLGGVTVLKTSAKLVPKPDQPIFGQYGDIADKEATTVNVELIPYFAWNNREEPEMSVWLPITR